MHSRHHSCAIPINKSQNELKEETTKHLQPGGNPIKTHSGKANYKLSNISTSKPSSNSGLDIKTPNKFTRHHTQSHTKSCRTCYIYGVISTPKHESTPFNSNPLRTNKTECWLVRVIPPFPFHSTAATPSVCCRKTQYNFSTFFLRASG